MLVVPVPDADLGSLLQSVSRAEALVEDPVGGGVEGDREGEEPVEGSGPPWRWEVHPGGIRLPLRYGCGETGPGWGRNGERGVGMGAPGARRATAFPSYTLLHGIRGGVLGGWSLFSFVLSLARTLFLCDFFCAKPFSWDRSGRGAKGSLR